MGQERIGGVSIGEGISTILRKQKRIEIVYVRIRSYI